MKITTKLFSGLMNLDDSNEIFPNGHHKEAKNGVFRGNSNMIKGGSFTHHLQSLTRLVNAGNRRCNRVLVKDKNDGKYLVNKLLFGQIKK